MGGRWDAGQEQRDGQSFRRASRFSQMLEDWHLPPSTGSAKYDMREEAIQHGMAKGAAMKQKDLESKGVQFPCELVPLQCASERKQVIMKGSKEILFLPAFCNMAEQKNNHHSFIFMLVVGLECHLSLLELFSLLFFHIFQDLLFWLMLTFFSGLPHHHMCPLDNWSCWQGLKRKQRLKRKLKIQRAHTSSSGLGFDMLSLVSEAQATARTACASNFHSIPFEEDPKEIPAGSDPRRSIWSIIPFHTLAHPDALRKLQGGNECSSLPIFSFPVIGMQSYISSASVV